MIDWVKVKNEGLDRRVKDYTEKNGKSDITIPIRDFLVLFDSLEQVCSEYGGAEISEVFYPVYEKYYEKGFSSI